MRKAGRYRVEVFATTLFAVAGLTCAASVFSTFSCEGPRTPGASGRKAIAFPRAVAIPGLDPGREQGPSPEVGDDLIYYVVEVAKRWVEEGITDGVLEAYDGQPITGTEPMPESRIELWEYNLTKTAERCVGCFAVRELNKVIMSRDGKYVVFDGPNWHRPDVGVLTRDGYGGVFESGAILETGRGGRADFLCYDDWRNEIKWVYAVCTSVPNTAHRVVEEKFYEVIVSNADSFSFEENALDAGFYPNVGFSPEYLYGLFSEKDDYCLYRKRREGGSCEKLITVPWTHGFNTRDVIPLDGERWCVITPPSRSKDSGAPRPIYLVPLNRPGSFLRWDQVYYYVPAGWEVTTVQPPVGKGLVLSSVATVDDGGNRVRAKFALLDLQNLEVTPLFETEKVACSTPGVKVVAWLRCGDESYTLPSSKHINRVDD